MLAKVRKKMSCIRQRFVQWFWFALGVKPERVGFGKGSLTRLRESKHRKSRRKVHICLLDYSPKRWKFARMTAFWINERSRACTSSMNDDVERADIVWIYTQDPIRDDVRQRMLKTLKTAKTGGAVLNHPDVYNCYHWPETSTLLIKAGVNVPRCEFMESDIGTTMVVYKVEGSHARSKELMRYIGNRAGYRSFEFVDGRGHDGLYKRYRAFYLLGEVWPSTVLYSRDWDVKVQTRYRREYGFRLTQNEASQVKLLAETLNLQFFAVDFLRRKGDSQPVFTDINIYPDIISTVACNGFYGKWHTFDNFRRLGIPEPLGRPFWDVFDERMLHFAKMRSI